MPRAKLNQRLTRSLAVISISLATLMVTVPAEADSVAVKSINTSTGISIDTNLYLPAKVPAPAIMIAHGFGGSKDSVAPQAKFFQSKGYVVLTWSARGFGKSTGQIEMNSIGAEVADTKALITYLAEQKTVKLNSTGDPVVGIIGASYGGANSLMTASTDKRIDAVIADITWSNLNQDLFPQAISSGLGSNQPGPFKKVWAGTFFTAASFQGAYLGECGAFSEKWCSAYREAALTGAPNSEQIKLLDSVSPINYVKNIKAPTLITQGQADSLFPLNESYKSAAAIKAANPKLPLAMIWHSGGHDGGTDETAFLNEQSVKWFERYLQNQKVEMPRFQYTNINGAISVQDSTVVPKKFASNQFPFEGSTFSLPLQSEPVFLAAPIGGVPTALSAYPGIGAKIGRASCRERV